MTKLKRIFQRWDWLFVLALAPLLVFPATSRVWSLLLYPLILGLQGWAWAEVFPLTPLNPAILLMAIMTGVSALVTPDPQSSLVKIAGVLLGILVFFTIVRHSRTRQGWKVSLGMFSLAGMGVAVVGVLATNWLPSKIPQISALLSRLPARLTGLPGAEAGINANELAGALLWVVPLLVFALMAVLADPGWFAGASPKAKKQPWGSIAWVIFLFVSLAVNTGVLVLSQSRDGYLAVALAAPVLLVLLARGKLRYLMLGVLVLSVIVGVVVISHAGVETVFNQLFENLPARGVAFSINNMFGRMDIWRRAVWAIQQAPLTGLGMNIFRKAVYLQNPPFPDPGFDIAHAHDELLQSAIDLGLPGMLGFIALYVVSIPMLSGMLRAKRAWRLLALGLAGGLLAHFIFGITDAVALGAKPGFLFWWLLAMTCGLREQSQLSQETQS